MKTQNKKQTDNEDFVIWHDGNDFYKISMSNWNKVKNSINVNDRKPYSKKMTLSEVEKYID